MSQQKGKVVRSLEYCLERSQPALKDELIPGLRQEIIHSELSPDKAWREAKRRLQKLRTTVELNKEDEGLSRSYWWLAKTKRDHREKFEKLIKQEEKEMEKKVRISFLGGDAEFDYPNTFRLCNAVLRGIVESNAIDDFKNQPITTVNGLLQDSLKELLVEVLEKFGLEPFIEVLEKNGIKVKICGNCKNLHESPHDPERARGCTKDPSHPDLDLTADQRWLRKEENLYDSCQYWAPKEKEVSEKKTKNISRHPTSEEIVKRIQRKSAALSM